MEQNFSNLAELLVYQGNNFENSRALNFKENNILKSLSNKDFLEKSFYFACGLKELGLEKKFTIANYSYQNPIWLIVDLGSILAGAVTVPIFHNIAKDNFLHEIKDAQVKYIFTDNVDIIKIIKSENLLLKIITYGFNDKDSISFENLLDLGYKASKAGKYNLNDLVKNINSNDLATIIYTSGSTSKPKGVEITHQNLISQIFDSKKYFPLYENDIVLSYLPLAHIFERMVMMYYISCGVSIYFVDDIKNVGVFLREFSPTLMTTVPRMLEKVYARINDGIDSANLFKKIIGYLALKRALTKNPEQKVNYIDKIFDKIIYQKFRLALGGKMRMIICGGASLSNDLEKFYWNIGVNIYCGYGLTEASPVLATNCPSQYKIGTVGKAFPSVKLKLGDDGELLGSGLNIMQKYHNLENETKETIENGWLKTGDLAEINNEGFVKIIGRKKELFKNAYGKYVRPVPIEQKIIQEIPFLQGSLVIAENRKFTSALLFPDFELVLKLQKKYNFTGSAEDFLNSEIIKKFISKKINKINNIFDHWEQLKKFHIILQPISIESGEITPSMKLKRNVLEKKFNDVIESLYYN